MKWCFAGMIHDWNGSKHEIFTEEGYWEVAVGKLQRRFKERSYRWKLKKECYSLPNSLFCISHGSSVIDHCTLERSYRGKLQRRITETDCGKFEKKVIKYWSNMPINERGR